MQENKYPDHIGIIMDGNGRWATKRSLPRTMGHFEGIKAAKRVVKAATELQIPYITFYVFSTENWRRPKEEVKYLMNLLSSRLFSETDFYNRLGAKILIRGDLDKFPKDVATTMDATQEATRDNEKITVSLAVNYGGQDEIIRAVRKWAKFTEDRPCLNTETLRTFFDHPFIPPVDLIIRTGGEKRLSNFLLWDSAYAELAFFDTLWPQWGAAELKNACEDFAGRTRRFGGVLNE
ncbi:MAG: polyprenyl diphosphate synthase [Sphaerochaetaceae bacterium]|nr:polyprenyl diphosphate synthase [Sphaerochaetaceae bacterium]